MSQQLWFISNAFPFSIQIIFNVNEQKKCYEQFKPPKLLLFVTISTFFCYANDYALL